MQIKIWLDEEQAGKLEYIQQQTQQDIAELLKWMIDQSYEQIVQQTPQTTQKTALEIFRESGFIGCIEADSDISANYKSIVKDLIQQKFNRSPGSMIIADTGFSFALANRRDKYHQQTQRFLATMNESLVTTYPVLTETCYLLSNYNSSAVQCKFLTDIRNGVAEIFQIQPDHLGRMIQLMERYADLPMDFTDASLVVLAEHLGHGRILTVDRRDFSIYRWNNQNPFENFLLQ